MPTSLCEHGVQHSCHRTMIVVAASLCRGALALLPSAARRRSAVAKAPHIYGIGSTACLATVRFEAPVLAPEALRMVELSLPAP